MSRPSRSRPSPRPHARKPGAKSGGLGFRPLRWIRLLALGFFVSSVAAVLLFRFVPPPLTPLMAIRCAGMVLHGRFPALHKSWKPLEKISPRLAEAVVASEDQRFFDHHGFDWEAILSAFSVNERGKRKLGASTITQQTAKNLFLWPDRSWTRKGLEAYFTLLLELLWDKPRILEVYLNIIETGDGLYGAEAAAGRYFHVSAAALTAPQSALLAAVLPNPREWSPAHPTGYLRRRQSWILRQMAQLGPMPEGLSQGGPPPAVRRSAPVVESGSAPSPALPPVPGPDSLPPSPAPAQPSGPSLPPAPAGTSEFILPPEAPHSANAPRPSEALPSPPLPAPSRTPDPEVPPE